MTAMQIPWRLSSFLEIIFVREFSASLTKTRPRQQRIHEVLSYIKTHKNSILQIHTFCSSLLQIHANIHARAFNYEQVMTGIRIILHILW